MMEGYFVPASRMHRVYNSAFMNMLKREENSEVSRGRSRTSSTSSLRSSKRFVNFMNNPTKETAALQFGGDDNASACAYS